MHVRSEPKRQDKHYSHVKRDTRILSLKAPGSPGSFGFLGFLLGICHPCDRVSVQQVLPIWHRRWEQSIIDGDPARQDTGQPDNGWPERMRQQ